MAVKGTEAPAGLEPPEVDVKTLSTAEKLAKCKTLRDMAFERIRQNEELVFAAECLKRCIAGYADLPDDSTLAEVCYALGYSYDHGMGLPVDRRESSRWISKSAEMGNAQAKRHVRVVSRSLRKKRFLDLFLLSVVFFLGYVFVGLVGVISAAAVEDTRTDELDGSDTRSIPEAVWNTSLTMEATGEQRDELVRNAYRLLDKNSLSDNFEGTRGVVLHFTRAALTDDHTFNGPLKWLRDGFIERLLNDRCNAFVFNVLVIPAGRGNEANASGVGSHVDQTLIQPMIYAGQTAYQVSIGYINVPANMHGGTLNVARRKHAPRQGGILQFRGSLSHSVGSFCINDPEDKKPPPKSCKVDDSPKNSRVSFVLEQYRLPPEKLFRSVSFIFSPNGREESLLPVIYSLPLGPYIAELYLNWRKRTVKIKGPGDPDDPDDDDDDDDE